MWAGGIRSFVGRGERAEDSYAGWVGSQRCVRKRKGDGEGEERESFNKQGAGCAREGKRIEHEANLEN